VLHQEEDMDGVMLKRHDAIDEVEKEWLSIVENNDAKYIFQDIDLISAWYENLLKGREACIFSLWMGERCIAIIPMTIQVKFGAKVINSLYESCASICFPVVCEEYKDGIIRMFLDLLGQSDFQWDTLKFSELFTYDAYHRQVSEYVSSLDRSLYHIISEPTYCVDFDSPFDEYFRTYISKGSIKDYKRKANRLEKAAEHRYVFLHNDEALDNFDRFLEIENTGWKNEMGVATLCSPPDHAYLARLSEISCRRGVFFLAFLYVDDVPAAGHFGYVHEGVYYLVKTAYRDSYSFYSPSVLLFIETVRYFIQSCKNIRMLNFFPKSYGYKHKYTHSRNQCDTFVLTNKTIKARLLFALYKFKMKKHKNEDPWKYTTSKKALQYLTAGRNRVFRLFRN